MLVVNAPLLTYVSSLGTDDESQPLDMLADSTGSSHNCVSKWQVSSYANEWVSNIALHSRVVKLVLE